jgi:hypothetical protein
VLVKVRIRTSAKGISQRSSKMQPDKGQTRKSIKQRLALKSRLAKETLAEFLGTFIMIVSTSCCPKF